MDKLRHMAKDMTLNYAGEWNKSMVYRKNDVVRMHGSTYICTTDKLSEDRRMGSQYKPEHDKDAWEQYTSGYIWTGQWMDKGEYYPGDVINYNGEQYACVKHGRFIHPVYEGTTRGSSFWEKVSTNSNQNRGDRTIGFFNRNPFGWRCKVGNRDDFTNHGFTMGDVDYPGLDQGGLSVINGEYEATHVGYHNDYGWGGSEWNYGGQQMQAVSSVFAFWDEYDGNSPRGSSYTNSTSSAPWQRPRIIQAVGDTYHHYMFLFDTGEVFNAGWSGEGQKGDGGTNSRYYTKRVGRCNNDGGGFDYNQQIQQFQGSHGSRGTGLMIDIQAIKIGTSNEGDYANNSSSVMGALDINGQLWTWGYNGHSGLGRNFRYNNNWYNSYVPSKIPQQVFDNRKIRDFWLGGGNYQQGHALDEDGNLWAWGYNGYGALGLGDDQYQGQPRKVPYDFNRHGGIKKIIKAGYNSYVMTAVLTHDGVMHVAGYLPWVGENLYRSGYANGNDYWSGGKTFSPMQQIFWGAGRTMEMGASGMRFLGKVTELYNDVDDFWLNLDQGNSSMVLKQKSTGMLFALGVSQNYTSAQYAGFYDNSDFGDNHMVNNNMQHPVPMSATDTSGDIIDMKRSGSGNTDYRLRAFLHSTGRINTVGSGDVEARGRGPYNSRMIHSDSIGKLPWELDGTTDYNGTEMRCHEKMACLHGGTEDDGFCMIGQNDKVYAVGQHSGFDDARSSIIGLFPTRVIGF